MKQADRIRQMGVGVKLRELRKKSGMTTRSVASAMGTSPASINRNEKGRRLPNREEASALCALFGVTGEEKQALLERLSENADTASWLASGHLPDELASLMVLEREATAITDVQVALMPGLAQTADYARLVLGAPDITDNDLERRVAMRLGRQAILSRPDAPKMSFFLNEGALRRTLGNSSVLYGQLEHLLTLQRRRNVSIRVTPTEACESSANGHSQCTTCRTAPMSSSKRVASGSSSPTLPTPRRL